MKKIAIFCLAYVISFCMKADVIQEIKGMIQTPVEVSGIVIDSKSSERNKVIFNCHVNTHSDSFKNWLLMKTQMSEKEFQSLNEMYHNQLDPKDLDLAGELYNKDCALYIFFKANLISSFSQGISSHDLQNEYEHMSPELWFHIYDKKNGDKQLEFSIEKSDIIDAISLIIMNKEAENLLLDKFSFFQGVKLNQKITPIEVGFGVILDSISIKGNEVTYYNTISDFITSSISDEDKADIIWNMGRQIRQQVKGQRQKDEYGLSVFGIKMNYIWYKASDATPFCSVTYAYPSIDILEQNLYIDNTEYVVTEAEGNIAESSKGLEPGRINGKLGYLNEKGVFVIKPIFSQAYGFQEGIANVQYHSKFGYINRRGEFVIDPIYDYGEPFSDGLAIVRIDDKYGLIDKSGKYVAEPIYSYISRLDNNTFATTIDGLCGIMDNNGNFIVEAKYDGIGFSLKDGLRKIYYHDKVGFVDTDYNLIIAAEFDGARDFSAGLTAVSKNDKWGYIDKTGKIVIPLLYEEAYEFDNNLAIVKSKGKYGFINVRGDFVIPPIYDDLNNFTEGVSVVLKNDKYGVINRNGGIVIPAIYDRINRFNCGLAQCKIGDKYGYLDIKGNLVVEPQFDSAKDFSEGLAVVSINDKYGYIDKQGNVVIPMIFDDAFDFRDGYAKVWIEDSYCYIDKSGNYYYVRP